LPLGVKGFSSHPLNGIDGSGKEETELQMPTIINYEHHVDEWAQIDLNARTGRWLTSWYSVVVARSTRREDDRPVWRSPRPLGSRMVSGMSRPVAIERRDLAVAGSAERHARVGTVSATLCRDLRVPGGCRRLRHQRLGDLANCRPEFKLAVGRTP